MVAIAAPSVGATVSSSTRFSLVGRRQRSLLPSQRGSQAPRKLHSLAPRGSDDARRAARCFRVSASTVATTTADAEPPKQKKAAKVAAADEGSFVASLARGVQLVLANVLFAALQVIRTDAIVKMVTVLFPPKIKGTFEGLYASYKAQLVKAFNGDTARATKHLVDLFRDMIRVYAKQLLEKFRFGSYHTAMRKPFDYYMLGQRYVGLLIDFDRSVVRHPQRWTEIQQQLAAGENVILLANHQSEADAAFIPLLTEGTHPGLGEQVIYVAGDRVVTDLMAAPFSMGRNLLCVFSKKHMNDEPELKSFKMRQNIKTLKNMEKLFREGGKLVWIAPSGGRDRPKEGVLRPDKFDEGAVEMMRRVSMKKGMPDVHFYPMAMATFDLMPPPEKTEAELGEKRVVNYTGVGIALAEEMSTEAVDGEPSPTEKIYQAVCSEYELIKGSMSTSGEKFTLPADSIRPKRPGYLHY